MNTISHARAGNSAEAQPIVGQRAKETQPFGTLTRYPLGLSDQTRTTSVEALNQLLADSITEVCPGS